MSITLQWIAVAMILAIAGIAALLRVKNKSKSDGCDENRDGCAGCALKNKCAEPESGSKSRK